MDRYDVHKARAEYKPTCKNAGPISYGDSDYEDDRSQLSQDCTRPM
jgi:hypothetical protein